MGKHKIGRHVSLAIKNHLVLSAAASSVFRSRSAYHPIFLSQQFNTSTRYRHSLFNFSGSNSSTQSVDSAATLQSLETDWSGSSPILGPDINLPENLGRLGAVRMVIMLIILIMSQCPPMALNPVP